MKVVTKWRSAAFLDVLCAVAPLLLTAGFIYIALDSSAITLPDFRHEFWPAAHRLITGVNPYSRDWQNVSTGVAFPYPAMTAVAFVPLGALPRAVAEIAFLALSLAAIPATLALLGVRDRRVYGVALLWAPVVAAWQSGNITLLLGLGVALLWQYRDRPLIAGALVAVLISLKPFIWPLGLWLLATRRWSAARYGTVLCLLFNLVAWGIVGFDQFGAYRRLTAAVTSAMYRHSYSLVNLGLGLGLGRAGAYTLLVTVSLAVGAFCVLAAHRREEKSALGLCIALALLASPVVWSHYFALMLVPLALRQPRLSALWLLPLALWACPVKAVMPSQIILLLTVNAVLLMAATRRSSAAEPASKLAPEPA